VKRGIVVGVAGVAVVIAASAGCSSNKSSTGSAGSSSAPATGTQIIVDGQTQNVSGQVTCTAAGDNTNIGVGDATAGIGAVVSNGNPPLVHSVGIGAVNGITLGFSDAAPNNQGGSAGAAVNGKSWAIKGTATGVDMTNPQQPQPVTKPFEFDVTCP
jgi:ipoprotein LpqH